MTTRRRFKKALSVLAWNVMHFGRSARDGELGRDDAPRSIEERPVGPIVDFIAKKRPDVMAIYEVVGAQVFDQLLRKMPDYQFFVTEGEATQEILVGVRDDMTERALRLYSHLSERAGRRVNYLFLGDLNTMGMNVTYDDGDICATDEIERLRVRAEKRGMRLLEKTHPFTYWPGSESSLSPGDLDHVVVAQHLRVRQWEVRGASRALAGAGVGAVACPKTAEALVLGWPERAGDLAKDAWVGRYSDHGGIWVEVG